MSHKTVKPREYRPVDTRQPLRRFPSIPDLETKRPPSLLDHIRAGKVNLVEGDDVPLISAPETVDPPLFFNDFLIQDKEGKTQLPSLEEERLGLDSSAKKKTSKK